MKVAVLVLAFAAPHCLQAAITVYRAADFDIFVHLDAKADIAQYQAALGENAAACHFTSQRVSIFWAGFNMIRAEMLLLEQALKSKDEYTKFVLVSDDTFPLIEPHHLVSFFDTALNHINLRAIDKDDQFYPRYANFFILDHNATSLLGRQIEVSCFDDVLLARIDELRGMRAVGKSEITIFYGSQWWALSRTAAELVLNTYHCNHHLVKSFEYSAVPDEIFVQSIIGNTTDLQSSLRGSCVYVEWQKDPRPYVYQTLIDIPQLSGEYAFIRKIANDPIIASAMLRRVII